VTCYVSGVLMRLRLPRRALLLGAVLGLGCYSPTLPLPPPLKPDITLTDAGDYRVTGGVLPNSQVFALNTRTLLLDGQQTNYLGSYDFVLHEALAGDVISLWYEAGTDLSPAMSFDLPDLSQTASGGAGGTAGGAGSAGSGGSGGSAGMIAGGSSGSGAGGSSGAGSGG
jgi:uncharacterized membrane protein YgcG